MLARLARMLRLLREALSRACGAPDYDAYLAHERAHHPERTPKGYAEFFRMRQERAGQDRTRCC